MNRIFQRTEGRKHISGRKIQHVKVQKMHRAHVKSGVAEAQGGVEQMWERKSKSRAVARPGGLYIWSCAIWTILIVETQFITCMVGTLPSQAEQHV